MELLEANVCTWGGGDGGGGEEYITERLRSALDRSLFFANWVRFDILRGSCKRGGEAIKN